MRLFDIILLAECEVVVYSKIENLGDVQLFTIIDAQKALHGLPRYILDIHIKKITSSSNNQINVYI